MVCPRQVLGDDAPGGMTTGSDGVAVITWDVKGKSMNVLSLQGWDDLDALIDAALADDQEDPHGTNLPGP